MEGEGEGDSEKGMRRRVVFVLVGLETCLKFIVYPYFLQEM
jgi:hypothetical protein